MIHLHGGGWAPDESAWTGLFVTEAAERTGRRPLIVVVLWGETYEEGAAYHDDYRGDLIALGAGEVRIVQLVGAETLAVADFADADGLFIGGGLTPGYHAAVMGVAEQIRAAVAAGLPYLGMSAGAMIASDMALIGGWRLGGVQIAPDLASEGFDEVVLAPGLGLIRPTVDAHAGLGLVGRTAALVAEGRIAEAIAVDENTCAVIGTDGGVRAAGQGAVWRLIADAGNVTVLRLLDRN